MGKRNLSNKRPCPTCGSDKKYKKCCMDKDLAATIPKQLLLSKLAIIDKDGNKHLIDEQIGKLLIQKSDGEVTEADIKSVLSIYNLRDTLVLIGDFSRYIFHQNIKGLGRIGYNEESTNILITQFALAYIANILIMSGASNSNKDSFRSNPYSFLTLCNIYSNKLVNPDLLRINEGNEQFNNDHFISFMVRMWYEQMSLYQFSLTYLISRNIVLFFDLINKIEPTKFDNLSDIFFQENGITIEEYMKIGLCFFAGTNDRSVFTVSYLSSSNISGYKEILTEEKINRFLIIVASDYNDFIDYDNNINKSLDPIFTKNKFNTLFTYPFIKEEDNAYIMPNVLSFIYKVYGGIYWWFYDYFEKNDLSSGECLRLDFRTYFGYVFENYVGLILKEIYKKKKIIPEISYAKGGKKFTDWCVIDNEKCYIFEAKARQFALLSRQTGDLNLLVETELNKVVEAIVEVFKKVQDINKYDDLKELRGKEIIPFIIFLEVPLISSSLYNEKITALLSKAEKDKNLPGLLNFQYYLLSIDELELYDQVKNEIEIEDILNNIKNDNSQGFVSYISKLRSGKRVGNKYLDKIYNDFWGQDMR